MEQFVFGPLQENWLQSMVENPERQAIRSLGFYTSEDYTACCLGELHMCFHRMNGLPLPVIGYRICDGDIRDGIPYHIHVLTESWEKYGLYSAKGALVNEIVITTENRDGEETSVIYDSLASMNDRGWAWPQIAAYIRENPRNVLKNSV